MNKHFSRREFLQVSSAAMVASAALPAWSPAAAQTAPRGRFRGTFCLFSKPVPQWNWSELAKGAKGAGFGGIDLTVRTEGHVLPERVTTDLPKAVEAIRAEGLEVSMLSTELLSADQPTARPLLETAGKLSIPYIKAGYYRYKFTNVLEEFREFSRQFRGLVELAGKNGVQVGFHNHPNYVGASLWDTAWIIDNLDPKWCGYYYDLGQGGAANMGEDETKIAANLVIPRLKMIAVKDVTWVPGGPRGQHAIVCPLGTGMAPWKIFLHTLAQSDFHGPITMHLEFQTPGVTDNQGVALSRDKCPQVMVLAKQNLDTFKSLVQEAYGA